MPGQVRQDLLSVLAELSEHSPSVRFGQLIANLSYLAKGTHQRGDLGCRRHGTSGCRPQAPERTLR
jgi:hypothetical protein